MPSVSNIFFKNPLSVNKHFHTIWWLWYSNGNGLLYTNNDNVWFSEYVPISARQNTNDSVVPNNRQIYSSTNGLTNTETNIWLDLNIYSDSHWFVDYSGKNFTSGYCLYKE